MANHRSAKKRARQTLRRTARNTARKTRVKTIVKAFRAALAGGDQAASDQALAPAVRVLQKAASAGVLHPRCAARRAGRLARAHHRAFQAGLGATEA